MIPMMASHLVVEIATRRNDAVASIVDITMFVLLPKSIENIKDEEEITWLSIRYFNLMKNDTHTWYKME